MNIQSLDLHGVRHGDVERIVERLINKHWNTGCRFKIITGHSKPMQNLVTIVLNKYNVKSQVGSPFGNNNTYIMTEEV